MALIRNFMKKALERHPIITNAFIYGTLCVGAEFSQQTITRKVLAEPPIQYDLPCLGRFAIYGTGVGGPILAIWFRWLDKKYVGTTTKIVVKKLLMDQFLMTPNLLIVFYITMSILEGRDDLLDECRTKFVQTFKSSCMFWLPAQAVNFAIISPALRVTYVGLCSFAWINILCWIKRQEY